jgi:Lysophospholipase L1 and related esterases
VHTVTIIVSGPKILVYLGGLGGEPVFSVSDSSHSVGTVALFTQNKVNFDNLTIKQLSSTPKVIISNPISYSVKTTGAGTLQVSAVAVNVLSGHGVKFVLDGNEASSFIDLIEPYSGQFSGVSQGDHTVNAFIVDGAGQPISDPTAQDMNQKVGEGGKSLAAMGDSITSGVGDNPGGTDGDDASSDGRNISRGFTPILNNLITNYYLLHTPPLSIPVNCPNEGLPGTQSGRGAGNGVGAVGSMKTRHSQSQIWLIEYGTNDSGGSMPVPSGKGLNPGDPGYAGSFKDNMQKIITNLKNSGKIPLPAKVPFARNAPPNRILLIQDYNIVVDELVAANPPVALPDVYEPPDFYKYFDVNQNQNVFFDNIHPNENGYKSMADCWFAALCQSGILEVPQPATPPPCPSDPCNLP